MTNNMSSSTKAYIPCIPSQNHNLSFYAWPSHALRSETLEPADVFEKSNLQWLENTVLIQVACWITKLTRVMSKID